MRLSYLRFDGPGIESTLSDQLYMLPPCYFSYKALHKTLPHNKTNMLSHSILYFVSNRS